MNDLHLDVTSLRGGKCGGAWGDGPRGPGWWPRRRALGTGIAAAAVVLVPTPSNPNPPAGLVYYLYRFSVLYAATPAALDLVTPVKGAILEASPAEQVLAFQIVAANQVVGAPD